MRKIIKQPLSKSLKYAGVFVLSGVVTGIFLLPYCDFLFKCGCTFPWQSGVDLCNVYQANSPHCPWCEDRSLVLQIVPFVLVIAGQFAAVVFVDRKFHLSIVWLFLVGVAVFFILGALNGWFFRWLDNYPFFVF